jgi:Xaa-Pro aminopeptidase
MPVPVGRPEEVAQKAARVRSLMAEKNLKGILMRRSTSAAWITGGRHTHVGTTADNGASFILVTADKLYVLTNRIEAPRLENEEHLKLAGFEFLASNWYEPMPAAVDVAGGPVGADGPGGDGPNLLPELAAMRYSLHPDEIERYRWLGQVSGEVLQRVAKSVAPGLTEDQIAGRLGGEIMAEGIVPNVLLIATDERIFSYRHPLPTNKRLDRYAMLVLGTRRWGLHISCTRLVYFGKLPAELRRKSEATARIDATFITATRPGAPVAGIFRRAQEAYAAAGYPDEWQLHHQGGACGYGARDYVGTPSSKETVVLNQAFAWNPSIAGTKSEDTILVGERDNEILTAVDGWPMWTFVVDNRACRRPVVLEIA